MQSDIAETPRVLTYQHRYCPQQRCISLTSHIAFSLSVNCRLGSHGARCTSKYHHFRTSYIRGRRRGIVHRMEIRLNIECERTRMTVLTVYEQKEFALRSVVIALLPFGRNATCQLWHLNRNQAHRPDTP